MQPVISIEPITLADHKVLSLFPRGLTGPAPTIILYHGWFGSKDAQVAAAQLLACHGFRVLLPDLPGHGERPPLVADRPEAAYDHFWALIMQAIDEVETIAGETVDRGLARRSSIGIAGSSAGGMVAVSALGRYPWLRAAAGLNTCPSFEWLDSISTNAPPLQGADLDRLRTYDPVNLAGEISPRPLLLVHGTADTILPAEGARRFVEQARAGAYAPHPDRLNFTELPRLDHWVTIGMVATMQQWFERWITHES